MKTVYDRESGKSVTTHDADAAAAVRSGKYSYEPPVTDVEDMAVVDDDSPVVPERDAAGGEAGVLSPPTPASPESDDAG